MYLGDFNTGTVIDKLIGAMGTAPVTWGGTPTVAIKKSNNTALTTLGVTLTTDFGGRTGSNNIRIDLSQDTSFYAVGNEFDAFFTAGNVGGTSIIGMPAVSFSIRNRSPLRPDQAPTVTVAAVSGAVGSVASNVTAQSVATNVTAAQVLGNITGSVANVTGAVGSVGSNVTAVVTGNITGSVANVTGSVNSVGTNVTAVVSGNVTGSVANVTGGVGSVLSNVTAASVLGNITGSVNLVNTLTTYTGNTPQTGDGFTALTVMHGLIGKNQGMRDAAYDGSTNLTAYNLFLYDSAAHAVTNDGTTGVTHKYAVGNMYDGSNNLTASYTQLVS